MNLAMIEKVQAAAKPFLEEMQLTLVDLTARRQGQDFYIEIVVDHPRGGVTLEECALLNRRINEQLEIENVIPENYFLEVASPGLDRPLKTKEDFQRVVDCHVRFHLAAAVNEKLEWTGIIKEVGEDRVIVDVNSNAVIIPIQIINKAVQVIDI